MNQLLLRLLLNRLAKLPMNVSAAGAGDEGSGGWTGRHVTDGSIRIHMVVIYKEKDVC
jgi:hypothetical protein